jgi:hypothetical protein
MKIILMSLLAAGSVMLAQTNYLSINKEIESGNFLKASLIIDEMIEKNQLSTVEQFELNFQKDRLERIRLDFRKTAEDVLEFVRKYYPDADEKMLEKWETDGSLEFKIIDGKKLYFNRAAANLFRINKEAKKRKEEVDGVSVSALNKYLSTYIPEAVKESKETKSNLVKKVTHKLNYTVTVEPDAVPDREIIRCWLPFPREGHARQTDVKLISVNSSEYLIADNNNPQRTIYFEKAAKKGEPTIFNMVVEATNYAELSQINPYEIKPYDTSGDDFKNFISERPPHIVFTDGIKNYQMKLLVMKKILTSKQKKYLSG